VASRRGAVRATSLAQGRAHPARCGARGLLSSLSAASGKGAARGPADAEEAGLAEGQRALCAQMDSAAFLGFVVARHKKADALRRDAARPQALCGSGRHYPSGRRSPDGRHSHRPPSHPQPALPQRA